MHTLQEAIKKARQEKNISLALTSSKLGISEKILNQLENTPLTDIKIPPNVLQNYFLQYGDFLSLPEAEIIPALNILERQLLKEKKIGKKRWFDYLNQLIIISLLVFIVHYVYSIYKSNLYKPQKNQNISLMSISNSPYQKMRTINMHQEKTKVNISAPRISTS